ncbi:MAG: glycosyltransferase family 4 protein [Candidatus Paceibacterota bacterium]|jgi:glycosyltransferase involved in cell wall biosynthesis
MRILIACGTFEPEVSGMATYTPKLSRLLVEQGHSVQIVTYSSERHFSTDFTFPFSLKRIVRSGTFSNHIRFFFALWRRAHNADIIYFLDWPSADTLGFYACVLRKKPYIVSVGAEYIWEKYLGQERQPLPLSDFYERGLHKKYGIILSRIKSVLLGAGSVVFSSDQQRLLYIKYYGLNPKKTQVILNPVEEKKFDVSALSPSREKEIVFVGKFIKMKNIESAIRAFALWNNHQFRFTLIGEGPEKHAIQELVRDLGISDRVEFVPPMKKSDLYQRIINCYYVILPSWTDMSPHQIYECMSLGIPFLLTKENYLSINSKDFLKIDPRSLEDIVEKMQLLSDPFEYEKHLSSLRALEFSYSWEDVVGEYQKLFKLLG